MNRLIEEDFVNNYIIKSKRERLLFELCGKKRKDGIGRFSHYAEDILNSAKIQLKGQYIEKDLRDIVAKTNSHKCYVISYIDELDGREFNKNEILDIMLGCGMPSIAIFNDFAIIETEQEQGPAVKYLLQK